MLQKIFLIIFLVTVAFSNFVEAANKPKVAVMDLGEFSGAYTTEVNTAKVGSMVVDYMQQALAKDGRFSVIDTGPLESQPNAKDLQKAGLISPSRAGEIAKILGVDYLIYGNFSSLTGKDGIFEILKYGSGGKLYEIKAKIMIRIGRVQNDKEEMPVIAMAKGEGISKSSQVKAGKDSVSITIGTAKIPQESVHNAARKAAYDAVAKLLKNLPENFFN
ncbi:MAG: hypothetical protein IJT73_07215 [Selenomonadaceae bacterium]|nr:hypothetical protein [Selenomonadaceae bacterium]